MAEDVLERAAELQRRGEAFALATVVRCEAPTSAKPGAKALVLEDGTVAGWVGGACAEPVVAREALAALRDGRPRLLGLYGEGGQAPGRTEGVIALPMTCHSGGTLEIYVEPYLPKPLLVLIGHGPIVESLATLAPAAEHTVVRVEAGGAPEALAPLALTWRASVVVATHGDADEAALERALASAAGYVSLVASRQRAAVIVERLRRRGVGAESLGRLRAPAGLDIGAVTPEEIAVSILAEIIQERRSAKPAVAGETDAGGAAGLATPAPAAATDPICGMLVDVATARHRSELDGRTVYFCCLACKERFDREPERYRGAPA
jgi:xanthine dehydrogenase accessory factor